MRSSEYDGTYIHTYLGGRGRPVVAQMGAEHAPVALMYPQSVTCLISQSSDLQIGAPLQFDAEILSAGGDTGTR